jgi:hypothetical protein
MPNGAFRAIIDFDEKHSFKLAAGFLDICGWNEAEFWHRWNVLVTLENYTLIQNIIRSFLTGNKHRDGNKHNQSS